MVKYCLHNTKMASLTIFKCTVSSVKYIHTVVQLTSRALFVLHNYNSVPIKEQFPIPHSTQLLN